MDQQRKFARLPFKSNSTLKLTSPEEEYPTRLIDISLKGALVEKPPGIAAEPGTAVQLQVRLDDSQIAIYMKTEVAHEHAGRLGLRCRSIDMESMIHLRRLMELNLGDPGLLERELVSLG